MEAIMARPSSSRSQRRKPRKHLNNFSSSNHSNLFKTPRSPNSCLSSSSSGLNHRQRHFSFLHPYPSSIVVAAKDDVNASKRLKVIRRKEESMAAMAVECLIITSTNRLGPDPNELPKEIPSVLKSAPFSTSINEDPEKFSERERGRGSFEINNFMSQVKWHCREAWDGTDEASRTAPRDSTDEATKRRA